MKNSLAIFFQFRCSVYCVVSDCLCDEVAHVCDEDGEEDNGFPALNLESRRGEHPQQYDRAEEDRHVDGGDAGDGHGAYESGDAEDEEYVEDIGAEDVADGYAAVALACCYDGGGELGEGGASCDNGESDDGIADMESVGYADGMIDEDIGAYDEEEKSGEEEEDGLGDGVALRGCLGLVGIFGSVEGDGHEDDEEEQYDCCVES